MFTNKLRQSREIFENNWRTKKGKARISAVIPLKRFSKGKGKLWLVRVSSDSDKYNEWTSIDPKILQHKLNLVALLS